MSTLMMYDSTTPGAIPEDAPMVAGYIDGRYAWAPQDWRLFPKALKVRIAVFHATDDGDVLDVERGCSETWCCPLWAKMRRTAGLAIPTFYCRPTRPWADPYNQAAVIQALIDGGVNPLSVAWWLADYTGQAHMPPGAIACQYANDVLTGKPYDLSVVSDQAPWIPSGTWDLTYKGGENMRVDAHIPAAAIVGGRAWTDIDVPSGFGVSGKVILNGADALDLQALPKIESAARDIGGGKWRVNLDGLTGPCDIHIPLG